MFDKDVCHDCDVRTYLRSQARDFCGLTNDGSLVRIHRARQDVDPNKGSSAHRGDSECGEAVVAKHVDADRKVRRLADDCDCSCEGSNRDLWCIGGEEGGVTEVFDHDSVKTRFRE